MSLDQATGMGPYDLVASEAAFHAHPLIHRMRAEAPVYWSPQLNAWVVTRYDDIAQALKDPRLTAGSMVGQLDMLPEEPRAALAPLRTAVAMWMGHTNNDDHVRMQRLLKKYFTPVMVDGLRPRAQAIVDELIDAVQDRGAFELVKDLAYPMPARVIAEMLGVPREDRDLLPQWSRDLLSVFMPFDMQRLLQGQKSVLEMMDYMRRIIAERRRAPEAQDIISAFLAAQADGSILNEEEILANCVLLLFAGHETTANLISKGLLLLFQHPDQLALLKQKPELLPNAIEEMLRFDGPAHMITRLSVAPLELGGKEIKPYQLLYVVLAGGNRDPSCYPDPDRFDITRSTARHLGFGQGSFYCLGAALARMEGQVCFSTMLRRLPDLRLESAPSWEPTPPLNRALISLPVAFSRAG
jgi:cytochrome P450